MCSRGGGEGRPRRSSGWGPAEEKQGWGPAEEKLAGAGRGGALEEREAAMAVADHGERSGGMGKKRSGKTVRTGAPAGDEVDVFAICPMFAVCSKK
jgi:hypothetical protein